GELQGLLEVLVDYGIDPGRRNAVGEQRGHDGACAAPDVDVEAAAPVEPLLDRGDDAHLVHATDHTATCQRQRVALPPRPPPSNHALEKIHDVQLIVISPPIALPPGPLSANTRF